MSLARVPLVRLPLELAAVLLVAGFVQAAIARLFPGSRAIVIAALVASVVGAYVALVRVIERRPVDELAAARAIPDAAAGALLGAALFSATIAVLWLLGDYRVTGTAPFAAALPALGGSASAAVTEEIAFRGIVFRNLEDQWGTWVALGVSALLFGLLHIFNPHASLWAAVAIAVEAGLLLGAAYVLTRRLWMPIGLHFAWNFTEGGIFGAAVSGMQPRSMVRATLAGPDILSGGRFGPEASVLAVLFCVLAAAVLIARALSRGCLRHAKPAPPPDPTTVPKE